MSPSASLVLALAVSTSSVTGLDGLMLTAVIDGAALLPVTVTVSLRAVPVSLPSSGVTVQVTTSPSASAPE